jgi:hypothetical protein
MSDTGSSLVARISLWSTTAPLHAGRSLAGTDVFSGGLTHGVRCDPRPGRGHVGPVAVEVEPDRVRDRRQVRLHGVTVAGPVELAAIEPVDEGAVRMADTHHDSAAPPRLMDLHRVRHLVSRRLRDYSVQDRIQFGNCGNPYLVTPLGILG